MLRNPVRRAVLDEVRATPGIHQRELSRRLDLANGALAYHLRQLEQARLIHSEVVDRRRMFFEGDVIPGDAELVPLGAERRILSYLKPFETASIPAIARALDVSYGDAGYHVRNLQARGLIEVSRGVHGLTVCLRQEV